MMSRLTWLLVDDLEEYLMPLAALLRRDGLDILTARSGPDALELLLVHEVSLAFVDVQMPGMDGFELAELMRGSERTRRIPIIFVTAGNRDTARPFKGYNLGAVDFLFKPIDPIILESKAAVFFELQQQKQLLAQELRARSETLQFNEMFTAVVGHDLRNPLNAILTAAHVLERRAPDAETNEIARRIVLSGRRMSRIIDDVLDLSRARLAGGIALNRTPGDLSQIVERAVHELGIAHPTRTVEVTVRGDVTGEWDADRLLQITSNLIGNAFQHGDPSGPVTVCVRGDSPESIVLSVTNSGVIPPHALPGLFEPFRSGQRTGEGLGLGLYIAQQLALAHAGTIAVTSNAATGTTFTLTVPRRAPQGAPP